MRIALLMATLMVSALGARADGMFEGMGNNALNTQIQNKIKDGSDPITVVRIRSGQGIELAPVTGTVFPVKMFPAAVAPAPLKPAEGLAPRRVKAKRQKPPRRAVDQLKRISKRAKTW